MKKRILFVDDEPRILQGLERSLRAMRAVWDIDFAIGGERAKECLAQQSYDVVLTDMMMPGMDGAQLLGYFRDHAPRTIRFVLSGHAEQHLAMKCVGLAHQYLSKPCDPATLQGTITRATDPAFAIRSEQVMALVGQLAHLPSIPALYTRITSLLADPDASMEDVGDLIARDMGMTAKILQLVNSSFFGLSRQLTKPAEAASYLGMATLKTLVLAANVFGQFEGVLPDGFSPELAAAHSEKVAQAARAIAQLEGASQMVVEESLLAGFLHDVGKLVLASSLPGKFQRVVENPNALEAEREIFGTTHAEVGGYLLGLWGLSASVVEAIGLHHTPSESPGCEFSALTAVHVANCLVSGDEAAPDEPYLERLGLTNRLPVWRAALDELAAPLALC